MICTGCNQEAPKHLRFHRRCSYSVDRTECLVVDCKEPLVEGVCFCISHSMKYDLCQNKYAGIDDMANNDFRA